LTEAPDDLVQQYYERHTVGDDACLTPGALFRAPILELENEPWFAHLDRIDPTHQRPSTFLLGKRRRDADPFDHTPTKEPGLEVESNEALVVFKAKKRPVVLFSLSPGEWRLRSGRPADEAFLCIPSYTIEGYAPEHVAAVRCFKYATLFYLPEDLEFRRKEAMLRFDRSQLVLKSQLERISPSQRLTTDALMLLQGWFRYWMTGTTEDWILQYQEQQMARLVASEPK